MSLPADIYTLLGSLFTGGPYANVAPFGTALPYATYARIAAIEQVTLDTNGGTGNAVNTRLQLDVFAQSYAQAQAKAGAVKAALKSWALENVVLDEQDMYEADTEIHRVMLDISIWHF